MLQPILLGVLLLTLETSAQVQRCPMFFPEECNCSNTLVGPDIHCVTIPMYDIWDVRQTFDDISDAINNDNATMYRVVLDGTYLLEPQEVPATSISRLKTQSLDIRADGKLSLDPEAFSGIYDTVMYFSLGQMTNYSTQDAFELFNKFIRLQVLEVHSGTSLDLIPTNAFTSDLVDLSAIYIHDTGVTSIYSNPFAALPNLQTVSLIGNNISSLQYNAFNFRQENVYLILEKAMEFDYLPQGVFETFLEDNKNALWVGSGSPLDPQYFLSCDNRMDWFCNTGTTRLYGYYCKEQEYYVDIYGYCYQKFGLSPIVKYDEKKRKKIQLADRKHRDINDIKLKQLRQR